MASHASVLTGLYPPRHKVRLHGPSILDDRALTMPTLLKEFGFETVLSSDNGILFKSPGLMRGFNHVFKTANDNGLFSLLEQIRDKRMFLLVHFMDVHCPFLHSDYEIHPGYNDDFYEHLRNLYEQTGEDIDIESIKTEGKHYEAWNLLCEKYAFDMHTLFPLYVKGVSKFDQGRFRHFFQKMGELHLTEDALIVIFSDHGEGKSQEPSSPYFGHAGSLHDSVIRVPLILRHPDLKPETIDDQVSLVSLFPTVLEMAGIEKWQDNLPYYLDGKTLLPTIMGEEAGDREAYSEVWMSYPDNPLSEENWFLWQRGVRTEEKKYLVYGRPEDFLEGRVFNLENEDFLKAVFRGLLYFPFDPQKNPLYKKLLNRLENGSSKKEVFNLFLESEWFKNRKQFSIFQLKEDPDEMYPLDPTTDPLLTVEFSYYYGRIINLNKGELLESNHSPLALSPMGELKEQPTNNLRDKTEKSIEIIKDALERFGKWNIGVFFTREKETAALLYLIKKTFHEIIPFRVFHLDTLNEAKEVYEFRDTLAQNWGLYLIILKDEKTLKKVIQRYKIKACMVAGKLDAQEVREGEGSCDEWNGLIRICPLSHFTEQDLWDYIRTYQIPYLSLDGNQFQGMRGEPGINDTRPKSSKLDREDEEKEELMKRLKDLGYLA
jgi:3'-phosphoadenosine 5'-phosphosulfate sulfotransferase (PAPS reductase)/FAD synthetase